MQRSLIQRLVPPLAARLRLSSNCSFSSSSSSVVHHVTSSSSSDSDVEPVHITENCVRVCFLSLLVVIIFISIFLFLQLLDVFFQLL